MPRCSTFNLQVSVMSKRLAKHISTKVSFKITIRKRHVYIDIRWPWKRNQYFYLGTCVDEGSKIIFAFFSARYTIKFTEQKWKVLLIKSDTLVSIRILAFPIGIIQVSTPRKWSFLIYFSSFHDYRPPTTLISLVHNSLGEMECVKIVLFSFSKCEKCKSADT